MEFTGMGILGESMLMKVRAPDRVTFFHGFSSPLYSKPFFRTCRVSGPLRAKSVSEDPVGVGQEWAHRGGQRAPL